MAANAVVLSVCGQARNEGFADAEAMNWDNLRFLLALHRGGSVFAAARALGVSRSTIARRMAALEASAGVPLVERRLDGVRLTVTGESLVELAERMEADVHAAERILTGRDAALSGPLAISVFDVAAELLAPAFEALRKAHPQIELALHSSDRVASLHRRETDLAIRAPLAAPSSDLFGRLLGRIRYAVYGTAERVAESNPPWVLWDETRGAVGTWALARTIGDPLRVAVTVDRAHTMLALVRQGLGVGLLPVAQAKRYPELVALGSVPRDGQGLEVWALIHPDLRRAARVRAAMAILGAHAAACLG